MTTNRGAATLRTGSLKRVLGSVFAICAVIGTTIGGGILGTPGKIAHLLPNEWWYLGMWAFGGLNALLGATAWSELGAMIPLSGGPYSFARRALGEYAGFFVGYTVWLLYCSATAALLLLVGDYAAALIPVLAGHAMETAFAVLVTLCALNWHSVREGGRIQVVTTVGKTLALFALVVAAFVMPHASVAPPDVAATLPRGSALVVAAILAMQGIIFSYDSYYCSVYFSEELPDPGRAIPRAIFRGLAVIIPVYLLINLAFLKIVPIGAMDNDPFVAGTASRALFGVLGDPIIRTIVIVSVLGTLNAALMVCTRILYAMARDGLFAHQATRVNPGGTPITALLLSALLTSAFLLSGTFGAVLGVVALLMAINYLLAYLSLIVLRRREPATPRPYRAWGYPWTTGLAIAIGVVFVAGVAYSDVHNGAIALLLLAASYPLYRGTRRLFHIAA